MLMPQVNPSLFKQVLCLQRGAQWGGAATVTQPEMLKTMICCCRRSKTIKLPGVFGRMVAIELPKCVEGLDSSNRMANRRIAGLHEAFQ